MECCNVLFDLGDTVFADSTGIGVLIRLRKRARELGHQFFLVAPRPPIESILRMMKLEEFFSIQNSAASARLLMESAAQASPVNSSINQNVLQLQWRGDVTARNAVELGALTESELAQSGAGMSVVIDLSRVMFVDSSGVGLMLRFKKNLQRRNLELTFANPAEPVRNVLRHARLEEYLLGQKK